MATATKTGKKYRRRGINHLGFMEAKLRDLRGFATLAHELIQNADDAHDATTIVFDIREDALIVDNNGVFSDCGSVDEDTCQWKQDPEKNHYCDFHRFQDIASADKRIEEDTTGAFGIGFIAVYQITDHPELISNKRHWILQEEASENERIEECPGCNRCTRSALPGTRFILPWATDKKSAIRKALRAEIVTPRMKDALIEELQKSLPVAMIFLKKINSIEIKKNGRLLKRLERFFDQGRLTIRDVDSRKEVRWTILEGDFEEAATRIRNQNEGMIEEKRSHVVKIAVPDKLIANGLLCACLPTEQNTGLPFHINADFYTSSDRKKIIMANDYQSDWNRAAIEGASKCLAESFDVLPDQCGHKYLWEMIVSVFTVSQSAQKGERDGSFRSFWDDLHPALCDSPVVFTESGIWTRPGEVFLLVSDNEEEALPLFEMLDMEIIHHDIRSLVYRVKYAEDLKINRLELDHLVDALQDHGFDERVEYSSLPELLQQESGLFLLYNEILRLLNRQQSKDKKRELEQDLRKCAVIFGRDKALWPVHQIFYTDVETVALFDHFGGAVPFAEDFGEDYSQILRLCPRFTCTAAIQYLKSMFTQPEPPLLPREVSVRFIEWFETRKIEILASPTLKMDLVALPIYAGADGLHPLTQLALPGDFEDPLGFSSFVDLRLLGHLRDFLEAIGANRLTLSIYARDHVPRAFSANEPSPEQKRLLVKLLSRELAKLKEDNHEILSALQPLPFVECADQEFRRPTLVYFAEEAVRKILGDAAPIALLPAENKSTVTDFYEWAGVARQPRSMDIMKVVRHLIHEPPVEASIKTIADVCQFLGEKYKNETEPDALIEDLRSIRWLPVKGQRAQWCQPKETFTVFREYLFATQANFLNLPLPIQQSAVAFFALIGVKTEPTPELVVKHLLNCSSEGIDVNREVYSYLMDRATEQIINRLRDKSCLSLGGGRYVSPDKVYWSCHPFGRYRHELSSELRKYNEFLGKLGVREAPGPKDAMLVLQEISTEFGSGNRVLDSDVKTVCLACWKMLTEALTTEIVTQQEIHDFAEKKRLIPDARDLLNPPEHIFFEDRAGIGAKFGEFLKYNTIPRTQGAWQAMAAAGVRPLSEAVQVRLLESADPCRDEEMESRFANRKHLIERVLEPHKEIIIHRDLFSILECRRTTDLKIQFVLAAFNTHKFSPPESVPAFCDRNEALLYFVRRNGTIPWTSIARELALAIAPDGDPGLLASGLKDVLSADSEASAQMILDELGYAPLDIIDVKPAEGPTVTELGSPMPPDFVPPEVTSGLQVDGKTMDAGGEAAGGEISQPESPEVQGNAVGTGSLEKPVEGDISAGEALKGIFGPAGVPETGGDSGVGVDTEPREVENGEGTHTPRKDKESKKKQVKRKNILRSIVYPEGALTGEDEEDPDKAEHRSQVDEAGIRCVVEYEKKQGRFPRVMPHKNPGYDIESKDKWGDIERYIEVKSLSDQWIIGNAVLSKTQFDKATELDDRFWLYVVERAEAGDARLHRIQNPANRVDQFVFDDHWMALALQDEQE
jgi:hypothetical protein